MSVYGVDGNILSSVFNANSTALSVAYNALGVIVYSSSYEDEISVETLRNENTNTTYHVVHIPQTHRNGEKQYPFVYAPNGTGGATQSTFEMNQNCGFLVAINAGVFNMPSSGIYTPIGTIIQNSQVVQQGSSADMTTFFAEKKVLTINNAGELSYCGVDDNANTLIQNDIVSAVHSFVPVVINFQDAADVIENSYFTNDADAQRQILGQYENGDYVVISCEGRGFENSVGFTMPQVRAMCVAMGLKFAFLLDGGGSMETVIGSTQINPFYEGTNGRKVPTYIVFNGTTEFFVPNQ